MELIKQYFDEEFGSYMTFDQGTRFVASPRFRKIEVINKKSEHLDYKYQVNTAIWNGDGEEWEDWREVPFIIQEDVIQYIKDFFDKPYT